MIISTIFVISFIISLFYENTIFLFIVAIMINLLLVAKYRDNQPLFILYIFVVTYLLYLTPYYLMNIKFTVYTEFSDDRYYSATMRVYSSFLLFLYLFTAYGKKRSIIPELREFRGVIKNEFVYYLAIAAMVILTFFALRGENIFSSGGYGKGEVEASGLSEYFLIFLIIATLSSKKSNKIKTYAIISCAVLYVIRILLFGGRIPAIEVTLLVFILFFNNRFKNSTIMILCGIGILFNEIFSLIRANPYQALAMVMNRTKEVEYIASNQGDVFYSTTVFIALKDNGILDLSFRIKSLLGFLLSFFSPSSLLWPETRISAYISTVSPLGGGGLIPGFFYLWFGYPGVLLCSFLVYKVIESVERLDIVNAKWVFLVLAMATFPRWIAYSPISLYKLCVWGIIVYSCVAVFDTFTRIMLNKKQNHSYLKNGWHQKK